MRVTIHISMAELSSIQKARQFLDRRGRSSKTEERVYADDVLVSRGFSTKARLLNDLNGQEVRVYTHLRQAENIHAVGLYETHEVMVHDRSEMYVRVGPNQLRRATSEELSHFGKQLEEQQRSARLS